MKWIVLPAALALTIGAGAFAAEAQTTGTTTGSGTGDKSGSAMPQHQSQGSSTQSGQSSATPGTTQMHAMSQAKLRDALGKAGFTDVTVVDASYMVQAKSSDGQPVIMFINPPMVSGSTATSGAGTGTSGSGTSMSHGSSGATSGSSVDKSPGSNQSQSKQ